MARIVEVTDLTGTGAGCICGTDGRTAAQPPGRGAGAVYCGSPKVIARALDAGYEPISLLMEPRQIEGQGREILERCPDVPVYTAQREVLAELTGYR